MPFFEPAPCKKVYLEFDTSMRGVCEILAGFVRATVDDCEHNPRLAADLVSRCSALLAGTTLEGSSPPVAAWHYRRIPKDTWTMYSVLAERFVGQTIEADCDQISVALGAYFRLIFPTRRIYIAATQPRTNEAGRGYGMGHVFNYVGERRIDGSTLCGMNTPRAGDAFYGSGESARVEI